MPVGKPPCPPKRKSKGKRLVCGNGLVLVRDYSRNKGGLFSSRMEWNIVTAHYPLRFICIYV